MVDRLTPRSHAVIKQWPIVVLRVYTGLFFAWHGLGKLRQDIFPGEMEGFLNAQSGKTFDFYQPFIESFVIPNKALFASLVAWGELFVGVAMILGLATRYADGTGVLLVLNFWFAKGQGFFEGANHDVVWLVIFVILGLIPAGRIAGLDDGLSDKLKFLR